MYPWWQADDQAAWSRAVERENPSAATIALWQKDESFESWLRLSGAEGPSDVRIDRDMERKERAWGGMWHVERQDAEYTRLRAAFETAQQEVQAEYEAERKRRRQREQEFRLWRNAQKAKAEAKTPKPVASTADREPEKQCEIEMESPAFFER